MKAIPAELAEESTTSTLSSSFSFPEKICTASPMNSICVKINKNVYTYRYTVVLQSLAKMLYTQSMDNRITCQNAPCRSGHGRHAGKLPLLHSCAFCEGCDRWFCRRYSILQVNCTLLSKKGVCSRGIYTWYIHDALFYCNSRNFHGC